MRHNAWKFMALGTFLLFCAPFAAARMPMGGQMHWHGPMSGMGPRKYNTATELTLKGSVEAVNQIRRMQGWSSTHLTIKTETETIDVRVGPSWFLMENKMIFAKGDQVQVTGSRVKFGTEDVLIAREIKKGDQTLTLRNTQGVPVWARKGMGHMWRPT